MNRREFLKFGLCASSLLICNDANASVSKNQFGIAPEFIDLEYRSLPKDLDGYKIGFIADIHLGGWMQDEMVMSALQIAKDNNCRLMLLGGDLIWVPNTPIPSIDNWYNKKYFHKSEEKNSEHIFSGLSSILKQFSFTDGILTVLGNHDRWSSNNAYQELYLSKSTDVLMNVQKVLSIGSSRLNIFGSEDYWTGIPDVPNFDSNPNTFNILLTHNPDFASFVLHNKNIKFNLSLSGHTHGGQVKLPMIGALGYNITDLRYKEGLVDYQDTKLYTSRGLGYVELPIRINCPPEVTIITLKKS
jgi:predicted MPP superfamily phosphohydrolase